MSVNSLFPCTARHWNSLPAERFPLTYDLKVFKSRVNTHPFLGGGGGGGGGALSNHLSSILFICFSPFSFNSMPPSSYSALHGVKTN